MSRKKTGLDEVAAREKIASQLSHLSVDQYKNREVRKGDDYDSVDYHIHHILKAGGGIWNETIAQHYIETIGVTKSEQHDSPRPLDSLV